MCRMALLFDVERENVEIMREEWLNNPHGWGLVFNDNKKLKEWHTVTSDVPIPLSFLTPFVEGMFHIRFATSRKQYGGTHPFVNSEMFFAHNGVISPSHGFDIDSLIIEDLYLQANGSFEDKMISVIRELNENYYGTWNIIAMTKDFKKAIAYCDGSLGLVKKKGKIIAVASDEKPFDYDLKFKEMKKGEFLYFEKKKNVWKIVEKRRINKRRWNNDHDRYIRRFVFDKYRNEKEKYNNRWSISKTNGNKDSREEVERDKWWEEDKNTWLYDDYNSFHFEEFENDDFEGVKKENKSNDRREKYD